MATTSKATTDGLVDIHRESALHLINRVKYTTDPPGDSFIQGFDSHILNAFPKLEQTLPKSSWARGDIIEIQGPAASGKTHLLYFWAMTCVLPYRLAITVGDHRETKEVLVGGRNKSVVVCDCDGRWSLRRLNTIITSYLRDRLATVLPTEAPPGLYDHTIFRAVANALKRVHVFRPSSTLALATTLMAIPAYHRTHMANEQIGMLMVDGVSSFYWTDRWAAEQMENEPAEVPAAGPQPPPPPPLRSDSNPLRHVLTVILNLRRSLGLVALLTNWGLTSLDSQLPSSTVYFRQHLRAPYPSPFESEPRSSKFPLTHHITIPSQGPEPFGENVSLEDAVGDRDHEDRVKTTRIRSMVRTVGKRPGEARTVVQSEFEFAITEGGVLVS
ncbi:hypothetical protein FRC11_009310 [Ceratobasidium sp. 423]|nr:hypothetical protein FRC11_009310 [Ceratobasidium sp. 423]